MAQRCSVCIHPERETIESLLVNRVPLRNIAQRYGMSTGPLSRHKKSHMGKGVVDKKDGERDELAGDKLIDEIGRIKDDARDIYLEAKDKHDYRTALLALDKQQKSIEILANMMLKLEELRKAGGKQQNIQIEYRLVGEDG